ncbi:MAG: DUF4115 domain-containing protein [Acetobacter sp.]|nr:DUF4115 domain-containing protein [Acetobacter sp.]
MMENTEDLDINIDDIGTILKSSRLKQKKSMEDISSELCIRKIYLTALEEGDYETLPPIPYGVGYVRCYARYLGLNPERAVKLYKAAFEQEGGQGEETTETPEVNKSSSKHIIAGILALAIIYGGWSWYTYSIASKTSETKPQEEVLTEETLVQETVTESVVTDENTTLTTEENIIEENIVPTEENTLVQTSVTELNTIEEQASEIVDDKVIVEFVGESWVELKDKNKIYFQGVFHQGDKKEIDYTNNLFLSVGRPQNVKVYIKGTEKDILVKRRKMNIPLDSLN